MTDPHTKAARITAWAASLEADGHYDGADALRANLTGEPWDSALGQAPGWQEVVLHKRRQEALRAILGALPPGLKGRAAATAVHGLLQGYVRSGRPNDRTGVRAALGDYLGAEGACSVGSLRRAIEELPPTIAIFWDAGIVPAGDWLIVTLALSQSGSVETGDGPDILQIPEARAADRSVRHRQPAA